jgi:polyisoprenoid-binding protein YceI
MTRQSLLNRTLRLLFKPKALIPIMLKRDKHLRSADFFEVDKYPVITFESTSFKNGQLTGNLLLRGITKPIALDVTQIGEGDDPWGGYSSGFEGQANVKATDFGLPGWVDDIAVSLQVESVRQ